MGGNNRITILVIDDDDAFTDAVDDFLLADPNYDVYVANTGERGLELLEEHRDYIGVILLDLRMDDLPGEELLKMLREDPSYAGMPVVIITADRDIDKEMEMLKAGADKFLVKPLSRNELLNAIREVLETPEDCRKIGWTGAEYDSQKGNELLGRSRIMMSLGKNIIDKADLNAPLLIVGDIGTEAELVAREIHKRSKRCKEPFVPIDCSILSRYELAYSEFWGHGNRAFPGALSRREGRILHAKDGIVFLDNIDKLGREMQDNLLEFLRTREFHHMGNNEETHSSNARVIAATNQEIDDLVVAGKFVEDLYDILGQNLIRIPSLRERQESPIEGEIFPLGQKSKVLIHNDIKVLTDYFMSRYNQTGRHEKPIKYIKLDALELLKEYDWPGNVRQLMNVIAEAASRALRERNDETITEEDIRTNEYFGVNPPPEPSGPITLDGLYERMLRGDEFDARRFVAKVSDMLYIANGDILEASRLGEVSEAKIEKYIEAAKDINSKS